MIKDYVKHLKEKFPTCKVEAIPFRDADIVIVSHKQGDEWFELPVSFDKDITQEQFDGAKEDLDRYELGISARLEAIDA